MTSERTKCWFSISHLKDLGIPEGIKSGNQKKCSSSFIFDFFFFKQYSFTEQYVSNTESDSCHIDVSRICMIPHSMSFIPRISEVDGKALLKWYRAQAAPYIITGTPEICFLYLIKCCGHFSYSVKVKTCCLLQEDKNRTTCISWNRRFQHTNGNHKLLDCIL